MFNFSYFFLIGEYIIECARFSFVDVTTFDTLSIPLKSNL